MRLFRAWIAVSLFLTAGANARQPTKTPKAMVVSQEPYATDVGVAVLKAGGNAVDAAVAVGFALAVTHPTAGNLGGGGFMLVRLADGRTSFLDFREQAPGAATRDMYLDPEGKPTRDSLVGPRASGVPGTVRGLELAHQKYGRRPWKELLAPAINLAEKGFAVSYALSDSLRNSKQLPQFPESTRIFQRGGRLYEPGEVFVQPELARTLQRIAKRGAKEFYEGETAKLLARYMADNGGLITLDDLKQYRPVERTPLAGKYREYDVITAPPPSSGGVGILQMMGLLAESGYEKTGAGSAAMIHYLAEVMRRYYADRSEYLGDPDFVKVPLTSLLDTEYIHQRRASIDRDHATPSSDLKPGTFKGHESTETTHISIVDAEGNAVAMTYTLNGGYGSGVTVPGAGFLLNNEMDDFSIKPGEPNLFGLIQGEADAIQPRKRPLSSMTPTMILRDGKLYLVAGAPGGSRIINGVLQVILNILDFGMNLQEAVDAPRVHHQWQPDKLYTEKGISPDTIALLQARGFTVEPNAAGVALVEAILVEPGVLHGAYDGRADGKAAGY